MCRFSSQVSKISSLGTPIQIAAVTLQKDMLELLLKAGADPDSPAGEGSSNSPFPPALVLAASKGACDIVKLLLECGANPDSADSEGFTPLHCAAEVDSPACAQLLLDSGADWGAVAKVNDLHKGAPSMALLCLRAGSHEEIARFPQDAHDICSVELRPAGTSAGRCAELVPSLSSVVHPICGVCSSLIRVQRLCLPRGKGKRR